MSFCDTAKISTTASGVKSKKQKTKNFRPGLHNTKWGNNRTSRQCGQPINVIDRRTKGKPNLFLG